jgi:hypothetical protein
MSIFFILEWHNKAIRKISPNQTFQQIHTRGFSWDTKVECSATWYTVLRK